MMSLVLAIGLDVHDGEGGIQRYSRHLARALEDLTNNGQCEAAEFISLWDCSTRRQSTGRFTFTPLGAGKTPIGLGKLWSLVRGALYVLQMRLTGRSPDVLVLTHLVTIPLAVLARILHRRVQVHLVLHGAEAWARLPSLSARAIAWAVDRIVPVSTYTAERFFSANPTIHMPHTVIACAVDTNVERRRQKRVAGRLVSVCRLQRADRDKNIDLLVSAMAAIRERHPETELFVVGEGDMRTDLQSLAESEGVGQYVHCLGWLADHQRNELFETSEVFVLPSTREGFGIAYLEAWLHGLPVIAGNSGAAIEVVRDGVDGIRVPPESSQIAQAVVTLLGDNTRREQLGRAGAERVHRSFSYTAFARRWARLLSDVGGAGPSSAPGLSPRQW
jgi:glycosyltransferase involved in cell wall biosynthesis